MMLKVYHLVKKKYLKDSIFFRAVKTRVDLGQRVNQLMNVTFHPFGCSGLHTSEFPNPPTSPLDRLDNTEFLMRSVAPRATRCPMVRAYFLTRPRSQPGAISQKASSCA